MVNNFLSFPVNQEWLSGISKNMKRETILKSLLLTFYIAVIASHLNMILIGLLVAQKQTGIKKKLKFDLVRTKGGRTNTKKKIFLFEKGTRQNKFVRDKVPHSKLQTKRQFWNDKNNFS